MRVVTLVLALSLGSVTLSSGQSLTLTPEWQLLKSSLSGIGLSLKAVESPLLDVSRYFDEERSKLRNERTTLTEDRRLFELDKQSWKTQKDTLEERGRLYDYLKAETEGLKVQLDKAYVDGLKWAAICGGVGVVVGLLVGGVLF